MCRDIYTNRFDDVVDNEAIVERIRNEILCRMEENVSVFRGQVKYLLPKVIFCNAVKLRTTSAHTLLAYTFSCQCCRLNGPNVVDGVRN